MFFSAHNFLGMTRGSLSPLSGPCEEARKCSRVGEAPSTTARRQQIRLSGPEVWACVMLPRNQKQPSSKPQKAQPVTEGGASSTSCPPETGPSSIKGKVSIQKSTMTQRKPGETVNGESPLIHSLNGRAGPSCNRQPLVALALLIKEPEAGKLTNPSPTASVRPRTTALWPSVCIALTVCRLSFSRALVSSDPELRANIYPSRERPNEDCFVSSSERIRVLFEWKSY